MSGKPIATDRLRAALEASPEVVFAYLFGSGSKGRPHRLSDVDVAVFVGRGALECRDGPRPEPVLPVPSRGS